MVPELRPQDQKLFRLAGYLIGNAHSLCKRSGAAEVFGHRAKDLGEDACANCLPCISMYTLIKLTAAGVTPGIREAWPSVRGRTRCSFSFISRERPLTLP